MRMLFWEIKAKKQYNDGDVVFNEIGYNNYEIRG